MLGKENVRSASVDNRSRAMWLLAGLGVLIWAALSVLLGGSPAHADDHSVRPPEPVHQQTSAAQQARPATPHASPAETPQRRAVRESAAPQMPAPQKPAPQKPAAGHTIAPPPTTTPAPRASAALPPAATERLNAATQRRDAAMHARDAARTLTQPAARTLALHRQDRGEHPAGRDHSGGPRRDSPHAEAAARHDARAAARHQAAHEAKHASDGTIRAHAPHPHRTTTVTAARTAPAPAAVTPAVTSGAASEKAPSPTPFDTRGASTQHQPAAPPSASSAGAGAGASAGVLPGALQASDVLGPLLTAVHAGDDVLPTGPAATTDHSPD